MKLRDPFPAPPFTHRFSALALAQGKPQKTPRTHTCEHMCAQCCSGMVSASTTPGHKAYLKHNLTQCVCWWGMGGHFPNSFASTLLLASSKALD